MAKTSLIIKSQRAPKFKSRAYTRCKLCGAPLRGFVSPLMRLIGKRPAPKPAPARARSATESLRPI